MAGFVIYLCAYVIITNNSTPSNNWGGYVVYTAENITSISANWNVPALESSNNSFVATWIGIGGASSNGNVTLIAKEIDSGNVVSTTSENALIQVGILSQGIGNSSQYHVFIETLPQPVTYYNQFQIKAGDNISASINLISYHLWQVKIENLNTGQSINEDISYLTNETTAEWIVEKPYSGSNFKLVNMANFNTIYFKNMSVSVNGNNENICNSGATEMTLISGYEIPSSGLSPVFINCSSFSFSNP